MSKLPKKPINVFVDAEVICLDHFSGIGHYTANLLRQVDKVVSKNKYRHINITLGAPSRMADRIDQYGFKNFKVQKMQTSPRLSNVLKKKRLAPPIDLLYGKNIYVFPNFTAWPTVKSPTVPIIYDLSFVLHPEYAEKRNREFLTQLAKQAATKAARVITISKNSKQEINEIYGIDNDKIDIIYPLIDKGQFYRRSANEVKKAKAKYGIFKDYFLFVGNIEPRKNLVGLLKAYDKLPSEIQQKYSLLLVGAKGWNDSEIHNTIKDMRSRGLKIIQPTHWVSDDDMPAIISGAKCFIYVSKYEGFGIPPVEAMFCHTPVISSDNSSLPEAVGKGALMVDANNETEIADAITKLVNDSKLQAKLIKAGQTHINKDMFVPSLMAEKFLDILQKIGNEYDTSQNN